MLSLKHITKDYQTGDSTVAALRGIDIEFRKSEFVSVLGPSGCGKTTLLNIIGGLDQYTEGDLVIEGRSTKEFRDGDWDAYRNHSVGFVFQSYNLIPHQSVLANVELALTLSGVSKAERRARAREALNRVGLGDQLNTKPNQMSGGQMQRVAIARALVNDPDILLADEPTGALDSVTSVQIMEILKEISADRLVIMVTHNPDLAGTYSSRIIRLLDGRVTDDSNPYNAGSDAPALSREDQKKRRLLGKTASMSFLTALGLSLNNLMTKKTRTLLTAFAGSIGIIGIALILSVSTGVQNYIDRVQEDTLSSYPIRLQAETYDMSAMVSALVGIRHAEESAEREEGTVRVSSVVYDLMNSMNAAETTKNNLGAFREYLESHDEFGQYASSVQYAYDIDLNILVRNADGEIVKSDILDLFQSVYASIGMTIPESAMSGMSRMQVWEELLPGEDGELINPLLYEQYDLLYGRWPAAADELALVVDENNEITDMTLYALGLRTGGELMRSVVSAQRGEQLDLDALRLTWTYEDLCGVTLRYIAPADCYQRQENGAWVNLAATQTGLDFLYDGAAGLRLSVVGIIRASDDAISSMLGGSLAYTGALTDYILQNTAANELVRAQLDDPLTDAISGLPFAGPSAGLTDAEKAEAARAYLAALPESEKAAVYTRLMAEPDEETVAAAAQQFLAATGADDLNAMMTQMFASQTGTDSATIQNYLASMDEDTRSAYIAQAVTAMMRERAASQLQARLAAMSAGELAAGLDRLLPDLDEAVAAALYDEYVPDDVSDSTYERNLQLLGYVDPDTPSSISIYAATFADKEALDDLIKQYNAAVPEEDQLSYTDYIALMMSSVSTIINAISYVLIAFVAISLVVSSIMIGIITYISVLERTKEIGILRAIGASKRDIGRVFNAETISIGFIAGAIGIGVTLLMTIPINLILHRLTGIMILNATLPGVGAAILVAISMLLTFIAGLIPSGIAARKDPVIALRTE
ncbi:MAG: ABC transporter ATP-binding protein/permease [Clostridia bacterium]|nr:ABC transporter ATP-binding protein/permease [Clostridia bacterium]